VCLYLNLLSLGFVTTDKVFIRFLPGAYGEEAEIVLPKLPETMQYVLGVTAGQILRKIHEILPKWSKNRGIPSLTEK